MAINKKKKGNVYDPANRIKQGIDSHFGEGFTENAEKIAKNRFAQIAETAAIVNTNPEMTEMDYSQENKKKRAKEFASHIIHTNPILKNEDTPIDEREITVEQQLNERTAALKDSANKISNLVEKQGFFGNVVSKTIGIRKNSTKKEKVEALVKFGIRSAAGYTTTGAIEYALQKNTSGAAFALTASTMTLVDWLVTSTMGVNNNRVTSLFNKNSITATESELINKALRSEKIKQGLLHATVGVAIPAAMSYSLKKVLPEHIRNNKAVKGLTSFGTLSSIGKLALTVVNHAHNEQMKRELFNKGNFAKVETGKPCDIYVDMARFAIHDQYASAMDPTILSGVAGSYFGMKYANNEIVTKINNATKYIPTNTQYGIVELSEQQMNDLDEFPIKKPKATITDEQYQAALEEMAKNYDEEAEKDAKLIANPVIHTLEENLQNVRDEMTPIINDNGKMKPVTLINEKGEEYIPTSKEYKEHKAKNSKKNSKKSA